MSGGDEEKGRASAFLKSFRESENPYISLVRELLWVAIVVGGIALALYLLCGTWPAVVTIESESMVPHMNVGDLVVVIKEDRMRPLQSWAEGQASNYSMFSNFGDVIIYRPNGADSVHPIIHRAMVWVDPGQQLQLKGPAGVFNYTAPSAGYITLGDNNQVIDQMGWMDYRGLGQIMPVKKEWIVGKAILAVPLLGYLPLNIIPVAIILIAAMILHEIYLARRKDPEEAPQKKKKKR